MSVTKVRGAAVWVASDGRREYEITPGAFGFVVRDRHTEEQIATIDDLSEAEDL
jgi:hypothetical protein